ncbi:hypothetical protein QLQ12_44535 [Actinoplanes sp. NEAU-A12]|uniref:Uncharacterized protein n=1 Tax=Actinoplanes sandaracinus TaxID=3045177 RepID=A0ABT6X0Z1_9ACTN|nr:hypothetical protein [Actinoplanes sandaracinus]MDI6105672.1 hypothetical protein [Actinoplanes sandaracinus]
MTGDLRARPDRRVRWWSVLRAALLLMWLVAVAASWWSAPRPAGYEEAKAAIAEQRLTAYQWGDSWDTGDQRPWFDGSTLRSEGNQGPIFAWRAGDGRVHWIDTGALDATGTAGTVEDGAYSGPGAAGIAQALIAAGVQDRAGAVDTPSPWISGAGAVLALFFFGVVVGGPAPVTGTRWFWFWLIYTAPFGLGMVFWLLRDRPWSAAARPARQVAGRETRARGWLGLLAGVAASFLLSAVVLVLNILLGDQWVP